ncbi:exodeoxyribonuclease V subunit gamma [Rhodohalobacter mucosus]|uniref:RecC C-terminal domain-containing protein n=1 Tax=Rhodohalobacter mucosus TaxID=2079485 RepID=A0A316TSQ5_9BACT|nr:exodeoxyribonuclease V subunit gamma [Rhodohalobacter mucosus]PWN07450.1 hypothetical protein DDZ15_04090 [Rhodohalobacter mucosus]
MIHIYRSNRLKEHAGLLAELPELSGHSDPFQSTHIIVPNLDSSRWLKLELARQNGFAGNLSFMLPAEWQWNQIRKLWPDIPTLLPSDPEPMAWALFRMLTDPDYLSQFDLLERYVNSRLSGIRENAIFELAGILSSLFDQYQIYRPHMLLGWQQGSTKKRKDEKWQSRIWKDLNQFKSGSRSDETGLNRAELVQKTISALKNGQIETDRDIYVFNPGLIPKPVAKMLELWGRSSDVHLFLMTSIGQSRSSGQDIHPLISSLGAEAEAQSLLWSFHPEKTRLNENESFLLPEGNELLHLIQRSIVKNEPSPEIDKPADGFETVRVVSCHSRLREIEALYDFIMECFDNDSSLSPEEILVVTPDLDPYRSSIHTVFGQTESGLPDIPYYLSKGISSEESELMRAVIQLFDLPESRFEFRSVMDLFMMRPVHTNFGLSPEDAARVKHWMKDNHVHWGLDEDHRREYDQPGSSLYHTWSAAMRRGWLGQLMAPEPGEIYRNALLYPGVQTLSDKEIWAAFSGFLQMLDQFREDAQKERPPSKWVEFLEKSLSDFLSAEAMEAIESHFINKSLQRFKDTVDIAEADRPVSYGIATKWLKKQISSAGSAGAQFNRGVTFTSMVPVRSIPFRVIAMVGLNEGVFPRKMTSADFDLMQLYPDPTDRNRRNEDRNLFLESILAAEDVHYCSFIGRSQADNEPVPPSPVVSEWIAFLSRFTGLEEKKIVTQVPLTGYSPSAYSDGYQAWSDSGYNTAKELRKGGKSINGLYRADVDLSDTFKGDRYIELHKLLNVVSNPIQGFLKEQFGARFSGYDEEKQEFEINGLQRHILFDRLFGWKLHKRTDIDYESVLLGSGILPAGRPGKMEFRGLLDSVEQAVAMIEQAGFEPTLRNISVELTLSGNQIMGDIQSYSDSLYLDLRVARKTAAALIRSWVSHLMFSLLNPENAGESVLITDLKNDPIKIVYSKTENPSELLQPYLELFEECISKPVPFYPETVLTYIENLEKGEDAAREKAARAFEGTGYKYSRAERDNLYTSVMMGTGVSFRDEMLDERYCSLVRDMLQHLREEK